LKDDSKSSLLLLIKKILRLFRGNRRRGENGMMSIKLEELQSEARDIVAAPRTAVKMHNQLQAQTCSAQGANWRSGDYELNRFQELEIRGIKLGCRKENGQ
jgi:hypothetical protein